MVDFHVAEAIADALLARPSPDAIISAAQAVIDRWDSPDWKDEKPMQKSQPIAEADCQIAAIARATDAPIATRNVKDFDGCGVRVINPWNDQ